MELEVSTGPDLGQILVQGLWLGQYADRRPADKRVKRKRSNNSGDIRFLIRFLVHSVGHTGKVRTLHNAWEAGLLLHVRHRRWLSQRARHLQVASLGFHVIDILDARLTIIEHRDFELERVPDSSLSLRTRLMAIGCARTRD